MRLCDIYKDEKKGRKEIEPTDNGEEDSND